MNADNATPQTRSDSSAAASASPRVRMSGPEKRATAALASIFALRMFGLFLVLPVLAIYARDMPGASASAIGLALGIYGGCQAIFQIPFGLASDRIGRKPVITFGLVLLIAGSLLAAVSDTVFMLIVSRALQGAGAVAAAVLALTADLTRADVRTRAMALVGVSIGASFVLALMAGPALVPLVGVPGLFVITAVLGVGAIALLWLVVPDPGRPSVPGARGSIGAVVSDSRLLSLNFGMFLLHATLMAMFVVVPVWLIDRFAMTLGIHWKLYVPVLLLSIPLFAVLVRRSHMPGATRPAMIISVALLIVSVLLLALGGSNFWVLALALTGFFSGFNTLEAMLPSLVSRLAPPTHKGAALGLFNTCQFLGIFAGGLAGGMLLDRAGGSAVFLILAAGLLVWLIWTLFGPTLEPVPPPPPAALRTIEIRIGPRTPAEAEALQERLAGYDGVAKVTVNPLEGLAQLDVDAERFDMRQLDEFAETVNIRI